MTSRGISAGRVAQVWRAAWVAAVLVATAGAQAFDLQGHRGARWHRPENTQAAFELALAQGATTLETDIAITRDGVLVLHHDRALNPDITRDDQGRWLEPGSPRYIHHMDWAQVQRLDVGRIRPGSRYATQFAQQQAVDGARIPTLAQLFDLVRRDEHRHVRLALETKISPLEPDSTPAPEPFARALVQAVREAGLQQRVQIMSFDWRTLQVVQRIAPEIPTVYLSAQQRWLDNIGAGAAETSPWTAGMGWREHGSVPGMIKAAGGRIWSVFQGDLDDERLKQAHDLGLKVLVWTVNDPAAMDRFITMGVDGLITDRPDTAREVLRRRGVTPR